MQVYGKEHNIVCNKQQEDFTLLSFKQDTKVGQSTVQQEAEFRVRLSHNFCFVYRLRCKPFKV